MSNFAHYKSLFIVHKLDVALLTLRSALAFIFLAHGAMMLMSDFETTSSILAKIGLPISATYVLAIAEITSAAMLLAGILASYAAWIQIFITLGILLLVNTGNGFSVQEGGYEYTLLLLASTVTILLAGPGKFVLEKRFGHKATTDREDGVSDTDTLAT